MLIERWAALASQGGGRFLVLVIDEAQGMTQREWLWLVELHSLLEKERLRLCVFSVASLQVFDEPVGMAMSGGAHVAARFMLASAPFHGIRDVDELRFVLSGYDEGTEWPKARASRSRQGLAPEAWADGFRMADHADGLMQAMVLELPCPVRGTHRVPDEDGGTGRPPRTAPRRRRRRSPGRDVHRLLAAHRRRLRPSRRSWPS
jgi:hypothetical protein